MKFLVFGGTQFMGRLTVEVLLDAGHNVVLFNRGRTANPFKGRANAEFVVCDRMEDRQGFKNAVRNAGTSDVVIDFTGFQAENVEDAVDALRVKDSDGRWRSTTRHYIFVSTDSVYWAKKVPCCAPTSAGLHETQAKDFMSQADFESHTTRCKETSFGEYHLRYGQNKLGCERALDKAWRSSRFPCTLLRLPDVYGPYDNLGGMWELVRAIEECRPIPAGIHHSRIRRNVGLATVDSGSLRFSWAFAEDVRDAIVACAYRGENAYGVTMHIAHEEAVTLRETAKMVAEAMGVSFEDLRFDENRESAMPSCDYGFLSVSKSINLLHPWRPTPMKEAVVRSVSWFLRSSETRQYHRLVHREQRLYENTTSNLRLVSAERREVPRCWSGAPAAEKAACVAAGPVVLSDALPNFTGQGVLSFMQRLMDQAGETDVSCELQRFGKIENQTWPFRKFVNDVLPQSIHTASYSLETKNILTKTDLLSEIRGPLSDLEIDDHELDSEASGNDEVCERDDMRNAVDAFAGDVSTTAAASVKAKRTPIVSRATVGPGVIMRGWPSGPKDPDILRVLEGVGSESCNDGGGDQTCVCATAGTAVQSCFSVSAKQRTPCSRNRMLRRRRVLRVGGVGARPPLRRAAQPDARDIGARGVVSGFWDCALLGRRVWRIFPPTTFSAVGNSMSRVDNSTNKMESLSADCFARGPDDWSMETNERGFGGDTSENVAVDVCWECEQTMGDAVVVPSGWWYQSYDDDRTLSISSTYRYPQACRPNVVPSLVEVPAEADVRPSVPTRKIVKSTAYADCVEGEEVDDFYEAVD
eukprot:TRINITY_DN74457_c0_g1_i1.p1 TRINITY_DN74457_c0_g1~~TRINITY_DN74457_c0_g1_i1.p1  ORF type:complete len:811 (-),score=135.10 TRINITY_DN74457_c0_g1_i1:27-2459(-)